PADARKFRTLRPAESDAARKECVRLGSYRWKAALGAAAGTAILRFLSTPRSAAITISTRPNVQTMVAPVGRSILRERYTPSAETSVPIVQPIARRGPMFSAYSIAPTDGTIR